MELIGCTSMNKAKGLLILGLSLLAVNGFAKVDYHLNKVENPSADEQDAYDRITAAMDSAVYMYNKYTHLSKHIEVYYNTGVQTADGNYNGTMRFGTGRSYMKVHTAMHEMAHIMGMGTTTEYRNMMDGGVFKGEYTQAKLKEITGDPKAELHGDSQHFWPYGLNYESEVKSEQDLIIHCQVVEAMYQDIFKEKVYMEQAKLVSGQTRTCMGMDSDNSIKMMDCADDATTIRIVEMGENGGSFRFEFGERVLDVPNESTAAGIVLGSYYWNSGAHQKYAMVDAPAGSTGSMYLQNQKSKLFVAVSGEKLVQENMDKNDPSPYTWILLDKNSVVEDSTDAGSAGEDSTGTTDVVDSTVTEPPVTDVDSADGLGVMVRRWSVMPGEVSREKRFDIKGRSYGQHRQKPKYFKLF